MHASQSRSELHDLRIFGWGIVLAIFHAFPASSAQAQTAQAQRPQTQSSQTKGSQASSWQSLFPNAPTMTPAGIAARESSTITHLPSTQAPRQTPDNSTRLCLTDRRSESPSSPQDISNHTDQDSMDAAMEVQSTDDLSVERMLAPLSNQAPLFTRTQEPLSTPSFEEAATCWLGDANERAHFRPFSYTWASPAFYHNPLYFEQPNLERFGNGTRKLFQPAVSAAHFFGSVPLAPYKMMVESPRSCTTTLGHKRPGDCVPIQSESFIPGIHLYRK